MVDSFQTGCLVAKVILYVPVRMFLFRNFTKSRRMGNEGILDTSNGTVKWLPEA